MASNSIDVLYSCTNCHNKYKLEELSQSQQLCKACKKKLPLVSCKYCRLDFHQTNSLSIEDNCDQCLKEYKQHGEPSNCSICNLPAAFKGPFCTRCAHSKKKYGPPVTCDHCKLKCAFRKTAEAKKKVEGKTLCLLCSYNYKKAIFKRKNPQHGQKNSSSIAPPPTKKSKIDLPSLSSYSSSNTANTPSSSDPLYQSTMISDSLSSGFVQENERLKSELSSLKKQVAAKDLLLLEKDKQICSLKAENHEREKEFRLKTTAQQRQFSDMSEQYKMEIQSLKKQIAKQTSSKPKHSENK